MKITGNILRLLKDFQQKKNMKKRGRKESEQFDVVSKNGNYISW
jgi:hypothetical protein